MGSPTFLSAIAASPAPLLGCVLTLPSITSAKIAARAGFQWVMIDMEHAPASAENVNNTVHAIVAASGGQCLPLIRIPSHGVEWIKWALDSGAKGIVIPMVNTEEEAEAIVQKALYPPRGSRSFGPTNALFADLSPTATLGSYLEQAQERGIAILPMIESRAGVENAEAIMSVDGVTGIFIGPQDLRLGLGLPAGRDGVEPAFVSAIDKILEIGKRLGKPVGSMGIGGEVARKRSQLGMKFLLCSGDAEALRNGLVSSLETVKNVL